MEDDGDFAEKDGDECGEEPEEGEDDSVPPEEVLAEDESVEFVEGAV